MNRRASNDRGNGRIGEVQLRRERVFERGSTEMEADRKVGSDAKFEGRIGWREI
jgi:hypothetical protein